MKNIIKLMALVMCALMVAACGSDSSNENKSGSKPIVIYTAAEDERIAFLDENLKKKFPNRDIVIQSLGTGQLLSKLQAEGKNTSCDIFYDMDSNNAEIVLSSNPDLFADLSDYDFSVYDSSVTPYLNRHKKYAVNGKTCGAFLVNVKLLKEKGLSVPKTYNDLLNPEYKALIAMPSPKSSGTGYSYLNGMTIKLGEAEAMKYFDKLNSNIKEYTTSGSAPVKGVKRGDVAIGFGLLWQCVQYANNDENLEVVIPDNEAPYSLFTMGMINGREKDAEIKAVFDYLYKELNMIQCSKFNPDKIYVKAIKNEISNYPIDFKEIVTDKVFDFKHKQALLDKWEY